MIRVQKTLTFTGHPVVVNSIWNAAKEKAQEEGSGIAAKILELLQEYSEGKPKINFFPGKEPE